VNCQSLDRMKKAEVREVQATHLVELLHEDLVLVALGAVQQLLVCMNEWIESGKCVN
jgi:hypothetical protein